MTTQTIRNGASIVINLQPGESLKVVAVSGNYTLTGMAGSVAGTTIAAAATGGTYGPYAAPVTVFMISSVSSEIDFDSGTAPVVASDTYAAMSFDSAGNVSGLVDPVSGRSLPFASGPIGLQNLAVSKSDLDANESGALFTLDIPANTLGPNSVLRIRTLWTVPSSAATKRLRGRFGGIVLWNMDLSTHVSYPLEFILSNRNSRSSQIAQGNNLSWAVALGSSPVQTFSIDFATAQQLTITAQWPVAGTGANNITLESAFVEHIYGA
jgi:hypothetical protein